jgi:hypothetical protein
MVAQDRDAAPRQPIGNLLRVAAQTVAGPGRDDANKANVRPSGEMAGFPSASVSAGGVVNRRFSPVATDSTNRARGSPGDAPSAVTKYLLSVSRPDMAEPS